MQKNSIKIGRNSENILKVKCICRSYSHKMLYVIGIPWYSYASFLYVYIKMLNIFLLFMIIIIKKITFSFKKKIIIL